MSKRFFRFGTWLAALGMVVTSFGPLAGHAAASATTAQFHILDSSGVVINEFMSQPSGNANEFIELYNTTASTVDLTGWALATAARGVIYTSPANALLGPNGYAVFTFSGQLGASNDAISLLNNHGATVDQVRYGQGSAAQLRAPAAGKSAGRLSDGSNNWYVDLAPSAGSSNAAANLTSLPTQPAAVWVTAGSGNSANTINRSNMAATYLSITSGTSAQANETLTGELLDRLGVLKAASAVSPLGSDTVRAGAIDTTAAPAMADGVVIVRALATSASGISSAYTLGAHVARDTAAPAAPLAAQVIGTTGMNADNVINSQSVHATQVRVSLPVSSINTDQLRVSLSDGMNTTSLDTPINQSGGSMTVVLDASGINDGVTYVQAWLVDSAGNVSTVFNGQVATKDTIAPDGTVTINGGATVSTGSTVSLAIAASDTGTGVSQMRIANTNDFAGTNFEPFATTKTWSLTPGEGLRTVYIQFKDGAGNVSPARNVLSTNEALVLVKSDAQSISLVSLATGTQTARQLPAEATVTATSPTNLTFASYPTNPAAAVPDGSTQVGQYVEIGASDPSKISFPAIVRIYYTNADLAAAGVTNENQLRGIAFAKGPSQAWTFYDNTGVSTADVTVDGQTYSGYAYAIADHLTPMTILADTTAPAVPGNVTVVAGRQEATISWNAVADASNYVVRYRHDSGAYTTVVVSGTTTKVTLTNLIAGKSYAIQVASRDSSGNTSSFTGASVTPLGGTVSSGQVSGTGSSTGTPTPTSSPTPSPSRAASPSTPTPSASPSASASPSSSGTTSSTSNYLVILAVLIIAIGAGTAGWYGYQWWVTRPGSQPPTPPTQAKPAPAHPTEPKPTPPASGPAQEPKSPTPSNEAPSSSSDSKPTPPKEGRW